MTTWQLVEHLREMFRQANTDNIAETLKDVDEYLTDLLKNWKPL